MFNKSSFGFRRYRPYHYDYGNDEGSCFSAWGDPCNSNAQCDSGRCCADEQCAWW